FCIPFWAVARNVNAFESRSGYLTITDYCLVSHTNLAWARRSPRVHEFRPQNSRLRCIHLRRSRNSQIVGDLLKVSAKAFIRKEALRCDFCLAPMSKTHF